MTLGTRHKDPNLYTASRCRVDMTRFDASLDLHLSDRTLARYELDEAVPPPGVVQAMGQLYKDPLLPVRYCTEVCPLGFIHDKPEVEVHNFPAAVCGLISEVPSFNEAVNDLAKMASDGKVTPDEEEIRAKIEKALKTARQKIATAQLAVAIQIASI